MSNFADNVQGDGYFRVKGDDWGFGWNIGYMWEPTESTRFRGVLSLQHQAHPGR